jgi:hypothetical protein
VLNIVIAVVVYECLLALAYILCWRLVRNVDTRLPIAQSGAAGAGARPDLRASRAGERRPPAIHWQIFTFLLSATTLGVVALSATGPLSDLRGALVAAGAATTPVTADSILLRLLLPFLHLVVLLVLYLRLRQSVLFPTIAVHLFLIVFCLLVNAFDPARMETGRLTLVPIFATNLVLLVVTHGLLTLLFCRSRRELLAAVVLAAIAGGILALGTMVISMVSTLFGGPLFFFQLYLVSTFGIFGLYFCVASILLSLLARD